MANRTEGRRRPVKKGKAQAQSPGEAEFPRDAVRAATYTVDLSWDYPQTNLIRIAHALCFNGGLTDEQLNLALDEIRSAARLYRGEAIYEKQQRPLPGKTRKQIRDLARSLEQLHGCVAALSPEARAELDSVGPAPCSQPVVPALENALKALGTASCSIREAAAVSSKTGRPPKRARRNFIQHLAAIWASVYGEWPIRPHPGCDVDAKNREDYPFNFFVRECAERVLGTRGFDDVIREVCEMDPAAAEAIVKTHNPPKARGEK